MVRGVDSFCARRDLRGFSLPAASLASVISKQSPCAAQNRRDWCPKPLCGSEERVCPLATPVMVDSHGDIEAALEAELDLALEAEEQPLVSAHLL